MWHYANENKDQKTQCEQPQVTIWYLNMSTTHTIK